MIRIFQQTYKSRNPLRDAELQECLAANMALEGVEVVTIDRNERITFAEWFAIINQHAGQDDISILCNSDIKFDQTIHLCNEIQPDECFCLTRWEKGGMHHVGSDAWVFRGQIRQVDDINFGLGIADCDYALNARLQLAGYRLANPSPDIRANHVHASNYRTYYGMAKIGPPHITNVPQLPLAKRKVTAPVFTCFSPSHAHYYHRYFLPSLPVGTDLRVTEMAQICKTGEYYTNGWKEQTGEKLKIMIEAAKTCDIFVYLDVDIKVRSPIFVQTMIEELGDADIAFQKDLNTCCTGCFVARGGDRMVSLFETALALLDGNGCDQNAVNSALKKKPDIAWNYLSSKFWNYSFFFAGEYDGRLKFHIPQDAVLVHANWCRGEKLKTAILDLA
jgi:hypothetical protein